MTLQQEWDMYWECTMGGKSHLNLMGKVMLFPLACFFAVIYFGLDLLFSKKD